MQFPPRKPVTSFCKRIYGLKKLRGAPLSFSSGISVPVSRISFPLHTPILGFKSVLWFSHELFNVLDAQTILDLNENLVAFISWGLDFAYKMRVKN